MYIFLFYYIHDIVKDNECFYLFLYSHINLESYYFIVNGHHRSALGSYLEAAAVVTEHFSRPLHRNILEDHIIKRMIKSCSQLQCHTQVSVIYSVIIFNLTFTDMFFY